MATLSKRICLHDPYVLTKITPEFHSLWGKHKIDMSLRELPPTSIVGYKNDLQNGFRRSGVRLMKLSGTSVEDVARLPRRVSTGTTVKHYLRVDQNKAKENRDRFGV